MAFTPAGRWLHLQSSNWAAAFPPALRGLVDLLIYIALVTALCELAVLPVELYRSRRLNRAFRPEQRGALRARLLGTVVLLPAVSAAGLLIVASGRFAAGAWWLVAGLLLSAGFGVAVRVGPAILGRLGRIAPLARPSLVARVEQLARTAGVPIAAIHEWRGDDASPTVAMVAGVGRGRRVLLAREVARDWSDDEVAVVVAHELAHHVHGDLMRSLGLNALVVWAGLLARDVLLAQGWPWLGGTSAADAAALPVIAFATLSVWLLATPVRHAQSRRQERRADRFALAATGHAEAFVTALRRASERHLVDDQPTTAIRWLFHRHPSVSERLALAERYRRERAGNA